MEWELGVEVESGSRVVFACRRQCGPADCKGPQEGNGGDEMKRSEKTKWIDVN